MNPTVTIFLVFTSISVARCAETRTTHKRVYLKSDIVNGHANYLNSGNSGSGNNLFEKHRSDDLSSKFKNTYSLTSQKGLESLQKSQANALSNSWNIALGKGYGYHTINNDHGKSTFASVNQHTPFSFPQNSYSKPQVVSLNQYYNKPRPVSYLPVNQQYDFSRQVPISFNSNKRFPVQVSSPVHYSSPQAVSGQLYNNQVSGLSIPQHFSGLSQFSGGSTPQQYSLPISQVPPIKMSQPIVVQLPQNYFNKEEENSGFNPGQSENFFSPIGGSLSGFKTNSYGNEFNGGFNSGYGNNNLNNYFDVSLGEPQQGFTGLASNSVESTQSPAAYGSDSNGYFGANAVVIMAANDDKQNEEGNSSANFSFEKGSKSRYY